MASRTLTVALKAIVAGYTGPMRAAAAATGPIEASLMRVQRAGAGMAKVGSTLTRRLSLPIAAVGFIATKMAVDFDNAFTKMRTLAGVTGDEVAGLKEKVLDLAGETGRAPTELAEALYFLNSAGLDSAQAMSALEVSAKASAAGMGSTVEIADAVSSAMLGYAKSGLSAAEATDVLVATAREGKAEPAELAAQMGRLVPVAAELGITFDQVGGAIAALSTKGFNAELATTALVNVMAKLLKPSQQAVKLLDQVGLSTDTIRQSIADKGLLATLEELKAKLGDAGFVAFLEDQQAVQGGLALLGGDLEATKGIMDAVANSAGATQNAFSTWADSMGAKNARAFAEFQVALIELGDVIAPIAADVAQAVAGIAEAFSNLPKGAQQAMVAALLLVAALGPALSIGGNLIRTYALVKGALIAFAVPAGAVSGAFNGINTSATGAAVATTRFGIALRGLTMVGLVVTGLIALREILGTMADDVDEVRVDQLVQDLQATAEAGEIAGKSLSEFLEWIRELGGKDPQEMQRRFKELDEALTKLAQQDPSQAAAAFKAVRDELGLTADEAERAFKGYAEYAEGAAAAGTASGDAEGGIASAEEAMAALGEETEEATSALQEYSDALKALTDPLFGAMDAIIGVRDAQVGLADAERGVIEAQVALNEAQAAGDPAAVAEATRNLEGAQRDLSDAQWATVTSAAEADSALAGLTDAVNAGDVSVDAFRDTLVTWVAQGFLTQSQADAAAKSVGLLADEAAAADEERVDIPVKTPGSEDSRERLRKVKDAAFDIPKGRNTNISAKDRASGIIDFVQGRLRNLDGRSATVTILQRTIFSQINAGPRPTGRQHGGPVAAGQLLTVGEAGPELAVFSQNGRVLSHADSMRAAAMSAPMTAAGGGGGTTIINNYSVSVPNYVGSRSELVSAINSELDRGARLGRNGRSR